MLRVWARLADTDLGVKLTLGFHLNGHGGDAPLEDNQLCVLRDRGLEGGPESRGPFWRVRAVYWVVTVGVGAPGKVWGMQRAYRGSQDCMGPPGFCRM